MRHSESPLAAALYLTLLDSPFLYHPLLHEPACAAGITHKTGYITQWKLGGHVCLSDHPRKLNSTSTPPRVSSDPIGSDPPYVSDSDQTPPTPEPEIVPSLLHVQIVSARKTSASAGSRLFHRCYTSIGTSVRPQNLHIDALARHASTAGRGQALF